jgi:hypothetical protein
VVEPPAPVSLALVVERSVSMAEPGTPYSARLADAALLATALLDRAPPGSQFSLLSFDDAAAHTLIAPTAERSAVRGALAALSTATAAPAQTFSTMALAGGGLVAALGRADALLDAGPDGPRAIILFSAGAGTTGALPPLASSLRLTIIELGGAGQDDGSREEGTAVAGVGRVDRIPFHTDDSAALPGLFAAYDRHLAELFGGGRLGFVAPIAGLSPGAHELVVSGCGAPQTASFEVGGAAPGPLLLLAACALPALGYGLWRRGRTAGAPGIETDTARYRSPLDVTTARRETGSGQRAELSAVVWDGRERHVHCLQARQITIGRDAGCAIRIESEWVSGLHARLSLAVDRVEIIDLESTNGTFIGEPARSLAPGEPVALALGSVVRIGPDVRLSICLADALPPEDADGGAVRR